MSILILLIIGFLIIAYLIKSPLFWLLIAFFVFMLLIEQLIKQAQKHKEQKRMIEEEKEEEQRKIEERRIYEAKRQKSIEAAERAYTKIEQGYAVPVDKTLPVVLRQPFQYMSSVTVAEVISKLSFLPSSRFDSALSGNFIVIDVETTGLNPVRDSILEISVVRFRKFEIESHMTSLINPKKDIPKNITDINGITNSMVSDAPTIECVAQSFFDYIGQEDYIVAHNIEFDVQFLYANSINLLAIKRKYYDTLNIARNKIMKSQISNYKLATLLSYYDIHTPRSHRALYDSIATGMLFKRLTD